MLKIDVLRSVIYRADRWQPHTRTGIRQSARQAAVHHRPPTVDHLIGVQIQIISVVAQKPAPHNFARQEVPLVRFNGGQVFLSNPGGVFDLCQGNAGALAAIAQNDAERLKCRNAGGVAVRSAFRRCGWGSQIDSTFAHNLLLFYTGASYLSNPTYDPPDSDSAAPRQPSGPAARSLRPCADY